LFAGLGEFLASDLGDALEHLAAASTGVVASSGLVAPSATVFAFEYARLLATVIREATERERLRVSTRGLSQDDLACCVERMGGIAARLDALRLPDEKIEGEIALESHRAVAELNKPVGTPNTDETRIGVAEATAEHSAEERRPEYLFRP